MVCQTSGPAKARQASSRKKSARHGEIYMIDGRLAFTYNLTEGSNSIAFNKAKFHTGLYIYKIWIDDEFKHTGKIVFVK